MVDPYGAMRLLRQDPWKYLVSYICSQNNNIDQIAGFVELVADNYGDPLTLDGVKLNSFSSPQSLLDVGKAQLNGLNPELNRGNRIHAAAGDIMGGELDLDDLRRVPYPQAKGVLMSYDGIGPKIADCVCLFSLDKAEAFPVDRHIATALWEHYGKKYTSGAKDVRLMEWARAYFGPTQVTLGNCCSMSNLIWEGGNFQKPKATLDPRAAAFWSRGLGRRLPDTLRPCIHPLP